MTHPPVPRLMHPRRTMRRAGVLAALCAVLVALLGVTAPAAWAHTELDSSDPADGGTVDRPPTSIRLVFAEQVRGADPVLTITVAGFAPVDAPAVIDNAVVTADLTAVDIPGPAAASYPVAWEVGYRLVALDGDNFSGHVDFTVTAPPDTAPGSTEAPTSTEAPPSTSSAPQTSPAASSSTSASTVSSSAPATSAAPSDSSAAGPGTTTSTSEESAAAPGTTDAPTADSPSAAVETAGSGGSGWWWAAAVVVVVLIAGGAYWFVRSRRAGTPTA